MDVVSITTASTCLLYMTTKERLISSIAVNQFGCWEWQRGKIHGYGKLKIGGIRVLAHRASYDEFVGDPKGFFVCHKCDNPPCINPKHLFLGTQRDNMLDAYNKGRIAVPVGCRFKKGHIPSTSNSKLSAERALQVKNLIQSRGRKSLRVLSAEIGVPKHILVDIIRGRSYKNSIASL